MAESEVAERAAAIEREISDAEAWELRYHQEVATNQGLRKALLAAQGTILALRQRVIEFEGKQMEFDHRALFERLDLLEGDELVLRDGKHLLIRNPEKSGPSDMEAGNMDAPDGVPSEEEAGE